MQSKKEKHKCRSQLQETLTLRGVQNRRGPAICVLKRRDFPGFLTVCFTVPEKELREYLNE